MVSAGVTRLGSASWQAGIATVADETINGMWREDAGNCTIDIGVCEVLSSEGPVAIDRTLYEDGHHVAALFGVPAATGGKPPQVLVIG